MLMESGVIAPLILNIPTTGLCPTRGNNKFPLQGYVLQEAIITSHYRVVSYKGLSLPPTTGLCPTKGYNYLPLQGYVLLEAIITSHYRVKSH